MEFSLLALGRVSIYFESVPDKAVVAQHSQLGTKSLSTSMTGGNQLKRLRYQVYNTGPPNPSVVNS